LGLVVGLVFGLFSALTFWVDTGGLVLGLVGGLVGKLVGGLVFGLILGLIFGLVMGLGSGLLEPRSVLVTASTPREASSRSLIAALTWLALGVGLGLVVGLGSVAWGLAQHWKAWLVVLLGFGLGFGLVLALRNGGWFVLLQRVARRRLARAGNLPPGPYDFLEWGMEKQIFRRVGAEYAFDTTSSSSS